MILLAVGVWGKVSLEAYLSLVSEDSTNAPYVLIGTGATIVIFGLFGCFATCRGSPWMLKLVGEDAVCAFPSRSTPRNCPSPFSSSVCHVLDLGVPGRARGWHLGLHLQTRGELPGRDIRALGTKWVVAAPKIKVSVLNSPDQGQTRHGLRKSSGVIQQHRQPQRRSGCYPEDGKWNVVSCTRLLHTVLIPRVLVFHVAALLRREKLHGLERDEIL